MSVELPDQVGDLVKLPVLGEWMETQGLGKGPIINCKLLSGGTQNILLAFEKGKKSYVLRRPPAHPQSNGNETMRREARVLRALAGTSVPHAALIAACGDEAILGAAFYLMEPVDGFNATQALPRLHAGDEHIRHAMGYALVDGISALGGIDYQAAGLGDFGKPGNFLERQTERWRSQLASYTKYQGWPGLESLPFVNAISDWLDRNRPAEYSPGILHGDYHLSNVMFCHDGPDLAAIVDWELATIGDPLLDLGWLLATWPDANGAGGAFDVQPWAGFPNADDLVARYGERSDRKVDAINWYAVLACFKLAIINEGTYARAFAGKAPQDAGNKLHELAVRLMHRAAAWME